MKKYLILVCTVVLLMAGPLFAQVMIIANQSVPDSVISQGELEEIFLGKRVKWSNNTRIDVVLTQDTGLHESFLKQYVGRTPSQFEYYWRKMLFTGQGRLPVTLKSEQDVINYVAKTPGAVGYIRSHPESEDIKILTVK